MSNSDSMYRWRRMTDDQRAAVMQQRKNERRPWHSPPHYESDATTYYMITAACYEHRPVIRRSPQRMLEFETRLLEAMKDGSRALFAWNVLPNHYHILFETLSVKSILMELGRLHGRSSFDWNAEEGLRGRQIWHNAAETAMKSEGHFFASLNYVLHNAVHHGYVERWTDWPYCNATDYLETVGRQRATQTWTEYPLYDYGKEWDPPDL